MISGIDCLRIVSDEVLDNLFFVEQHCVVKRSGSFAVSAECQLFAIRQRLDFFDAAILDCQVNGSDLCLALNSVWDRLQELNSRKLSTLRHIASRSTKYTLSKCKMIKQWCLIFCVIEHHNTVDARLNFHFSQNNSYRLLRFELPFKYSLDLSNILTLPPKLHKY